MCDDQRTSCGDHRVDLTAASAERVLRARIWCQNNLDALAWSQDHRGLFSFRDADAAAWFLMVWGTP